MESQITLLNRQVTDGSLQPTQPKDYDKSEFSKALALACSIKINKHLVYYTVIMKGQN
uniref:Uncharacterized protein n=1 Tax=Rhizophagus irregularis (strain DAOM 181602 / DAOM 197198 / MUCL 43194) TaxID=747089 RepID=U9T5X5_RHIID